jgi:SOS-response transcriptional repressor LexA
MIGDELQNLIRNRLGELGENPYSFETKHGFPKDTIRSVLRKDSKRSVPNIEKTKLICDALGLEFNIGPPRHNDADIPSHEIETPYYGDIAAGGSSDPNDQRIYWASEYWEGEHIPGPAGITAEEMQRFGGLFGLTVRGDSMLPIYKDGDSIFVYGEDPLRFEFSRLMGNPCAVTLTEEHNNAVYLKRLRRPDNNEPGYANLESLNPTFPTMVNIPIYSALPVRHHKPNL